MRYRRARVNGGTYFFTVNLAERRRSLLVDYVGVLRKVVGMVKERHPFTIDDSDFAGTPACGVDPAARGR